MTKVDKIIYGFLSVFISFFGSAYLILPILGKIINKYQTCGWPYGNILKDCWLGLASLISWPFQIVLYSIIIFKLIKRLKSHFSST